MTTNELKLDVIPGCLVNYALDKTLITIQTSPQEEELRLYTSIGVKLVKSRKISYKENEEEKGGITRIKRCHMSKHSPFVIVGEDEGLGPEICWDSSKDEVFDIPEAGFTHLLNQNKTFVTFTSLNGLNIKVCVPSQNPGETITTLETVSQLRVGESLISTPLVMSDTQIVFAQLNKEGIREICVFDCGVDPAGIVSRCDLRKLEVPEKNEIHDMFLTSDNTGVWIYHSNQNNNCNSKAVLLNPDVKCHAISVSGHVAGVIESLSDFHQLVPKQVEEDFDKLNFKSVTRDYSVHLHQWRQVLQDKFGEASLDSWLNRKQNSHVVSGVSLINFDASHLAIVVSSEPSNIYLVDWTDSAIRYYLKFKETKIRHCLFGALGMLYCYLSYFFFK